MDLTIMYYFPKYYFISKNLNIKYYFLIKNTWNFDLCEGDYRGDTSSPIVLLR